MRVSWRRNRRLPRGALTDQGPRRGSCSALCADQRPRPFSRFPNKLCPAWGPVRRHRRFAAIMHRRRYRDRQRKRRKRPSARSRSVMDRAASPSSNVTKPPPRPIRYDGRAQPIAARLLSSLSMDHFGFSRRSGHPGHLSDCPEELGRAVPSAQQLPATQPVRH